MKTARRAAALALAAGLVACGKPVANVSARFEGLTALVPFYGKTSKHPTANQPYFAATSPGGDELRFIDQTDLLTVLGPGLGLALSVVTDPRPVLLASAALEAPDATTGQHLDEADVLVAVSAGQLELQVIDTWSGAPAVAADRSVALGSALAAGDRIVSAVGVDADPGAAPPRPARIILGVSAASGAELGKLVMVEFDRDGDAVKARPVTAANVAVLGFRPEDIAVEPRADGAGSGSRLFVATKDPVTAARGVAVVETASGTPSTWTPTLLDARGAGTLSVAVAWVDERVVGTTYCSPEVFTGQPTLFVYAGLDPDTCGVDKAISCGVAKLDPVAGGLAKDPAASVPARANGRCATDPSTTSPCVPAQEYLAPIPVPGLPVHLTVARAPSAGKYRLVGDDPNVPSTDCPTRTTPSSPLTYLASGAGARYASAVAAVSSSDGGLYWIDLSRWSPVSDVSPATGGTSRTSVTVAYQLTSGTATGLGLWNELKIAQDEKTGAITTPAAAPTPEVVSSASLLPSAIEVRPGFTDTDTWAIVYQGELPGLAGRVAVLASDPVDPAHYYVAVQSESGASPDLTTAAAWVVGGTVADPALGVRANDIVTAAVTAGGTTTTCETTISGDPIPGPVTVGSILFPGGALRLPAPDACLQGLLDASGTSGRARVKLSVRATKFVLTNGKLGYLGRPELATTVAEPEFRLAWEDETGLTGERLALARKARRIFYPSMEGACPHATRDTPLRSQDEGCYGGFPRMKDPLEPGPVVAFKLGQVKDSTGNLVPYVRDDAIVFATTSGLSPTRSLSTSGGVLPGAGASFDWTALSRFGVSGHGDEPIRLLVPYLDGQVLVVSPTGSAFGTTIR